MIDIIIGQPISALIHPISPVNLTNPSRRARSWEYKTAQADVEECMRIECIC
jgi:hypothetical protein